MKAKIILATALLAGSTMVAAQTERPAAPAAQPAAEQDKAQATAQSPATPSQEPADQIGPDAAALQPSAAPPAAPEPADPVTLATSADVVAGAKVFDEKGGEVGTIESATAEAAIVSTGKARVQIPLRSFGKNKSGLVIAVSRAQLEAEAAKASPQGD